MERKILNLVFKYSQELIQKHIDKVVSSEVNYDFYVMNSANKLYRLSLVELNNIRKNILINETITKQNQALKEIFSIKEKHFGRDLESIMLNGEKRKIDYADLFGEDFENAINNLLWLDDAFSKSVVNQLEAACCLTDGQGQVYFSDQVSSSFIKYDIHSNLRKNYEVIITWGLRGFGLLMYIDKAIEVGLRNFRRDFLLKKCREYFLRLSPEKQMMFIKDYYSISSELELINKLQVDKKNTLSLNTDDNFKMEGVIGNSKQEEQFSKISPESALSVLQLNDETLGAFVIEKNLFDESKPEFLKNGLCEKKPVSSGNKKAKKKRKSIKRIKLEVFVGHLVEGGIFDTFPKFHDAMANQFLYMGGDKLQDHETYNEHAEVKRVYGVLSDEKKSKELKHKKYKVHFSFISSSGELLPQSPMSLSSFKNIFDFVRNNLRES